MVAKRGVNMFKGKNEGLGSKRSNKNLLFVAIILLLMVPVWIFYISPNIEKIPDDFSYNAEIFSIDNFYDESKLDFGGEFFSDTDFFYEVVDKKDGILIIKNTFDVKRFTGEKIFSVERLYGIDPRTGEHVPGYGDRDREGYLFAPRNPEKGRNFTYWHVNYNNPANMELKEEAEVKGLRVYRYETNYKADQTENLGHLPGVPEERGINLDVNLQLWVEPITGRMIKYEDRTTAYYYNLTTGERIHPWNKFRNRFHEASVREQVEAAEMEIFRLRMLKFVIPSLLTLVAIFFLILYFDPEIMKKMLKITIPSLHKK